jgi:hypothetical protein
MKEMLIFEIDGMTKKEILKDLGFTVKGEYVITDNDKMLIDNVEMIVSKNGKLTLLTDPIDVSDFFADIENEGDEKWE